MDIKNRIRLNIKTNTGIDFIFSAQAHWEISTLTTEIQILYKQLSGQSKHVLKNTIKRKNYIVPFNQHVGDIFNDNDELQCKMGNLEQGKKSTIVKEKGNVKNKKQGEHHDDKKDKKRKENNKEKKQKKVPQNQKKQDDSQRMQKLLKMIKLNKKPEKQESTHKKSNIIIKESDSD